MPKSMPHPITAEDEAGRGSPVTGSDVTAASPRLRAIAMQQ